MRLQVRESGNEVHIELHGVAGRHQRVLEALTECQRTGMCIVGEPAVALDASEVTVRAGANDMRIRLRGQGNHRIEAASIYRCLRRALFEHAEPVAAVAAAA